MSDLPIIQKTYDLIRWYVPILNRLRSGSLKRARRRLKLLQSRYASYQAGIPEIVQSIQSWEAHLNHGDTWRLRRQIFNLLVFSRR